MIPLAARLRDLGHNVIIGSGAEHLAFFRSELEGIKYVNFPGFKPIYSRLLPQYAILLLQMPILLYHIIKEHYRLKKIIAENGIDIVISDNRFGLWNRHIKTIYVTHMPVIPFPVPFRFLEFTGKFLHRLIIKKYNFCFIPDLPGDLNVSGRLTHGTEFPENVRYIGILSRFSESYLNNAIPASGTGYTVVILSGPEPQRSILKRKLVNIFNVRNESADILEGLPGIKNDTRISGNITFYDHLPSPEMEKKLRESKLIISRAGYSTIMELLSMNCSAFLVPTPGQTEQEYLARYLSEKGWFDAVPQKEINAGSFPIEINNRLPVMINERSRELLDKAIMEIFEY